MGGVVGSSGTDVGQPCWLPELTHGVQLVMERAEAAIYKLFAGKAR